MRANTPAGLAEGATGRDSGSEVGAAVAGVPRAAALTAAAAVVADLIVYVIAAAVADVPGTFGALFNPVTIAVSASVGVALAALGLAVLARVSGRAVPLFRAAAAVLTLLSLGTPLQAMAGAMPGFPAATTATGVSMIVMHLLTGGIIAVLLPALARR